MSELVNARRRERYANDPTYRESRKTAVRDRKRRLRVQDGQAPPEEAEERKLRRREQTAAAARRWAARNPDKRRANERRWRERNPDKVRAKNRRKNLRINYGMTVVDFDAMLAAQRGLCAICILPLGQAGKRHVDHDHATGKVRGILCSGCNLMIGHGRENPQTLENAATYLRRHQ